MRRLLVVLAAFVVVLGGVAVASTSRAPVSELEYVTLGAGDTWSSVVASNGLSCTATVLRDFNNRGTAYAGRGILIPPACQTTAAPTTTTVAPTTTQAPTTTVAPTTTQAPTTTVAPTTTTVPSTTTTTLPGLNYDPADWSLENTAIVPARPANDEGAFRTLCNAGHLSYDDPIAYPGQRGATHLHQFFGNLSVDFNTTQASLIGAGESTCDGGPINRTGYWIPALLSGSEVVVPSALVVYYKGESSSGVQPLPAGLRMIAGHSMATGGVANGRINWRCQSRGYANSQTIGGPCQGELLGQVEFPYCWDGVNLDSANHRSHMADADRSTGGWGTCPSSHPVMIPRITYTAIYNVTSADTLELSSDVMPGMTHTPGSTYHADWFNGWNQTYSSRWHAGCLLRQADCKPGNPGSQLGDGGQLVGRAPAPLPARVPIPPRP